MRNFSALDDEFSQRFIDHRKKNKRIGSQRCYADENVPNVNVVSLSLGGETVSKSHPGGSSITSRDLLHCVLLYRDIIAFKSSSSVAVSVPSSTPSPCFSGRESGFISTRRGGSEEVRSVRTNPLNADTL